MYFMYQLKYIKDEPEHYNCQMITEWGLLDADNYPEAMTLITNHYGEEDIEEINYLAPFTDNSVVIEYRDGESVWYVFDNSDTVSFVYDIACKFMN